jgi:hypothetical protein
VERFCSGLTFAAALDVLLGTLGIVFDTKMNVKELGNAACAHGHVQQSVDVLKRSWCQLS